MMSKVLMCAGAAMLLTLSAVAQSANDPVLFTVENTPVHVSEFTYIYSKTNGKNADFSKKSLDEYLDLYTKFKLKVQKAKDMRLDTVSQLKEELNGYRKQLADSYLIDKAVTEKLLLEAYERIKQDVDVSHVLVMLKPEATPADTLVAFQRALDIKKRLDSGDPFEVVAREMSDDKSAARNGGNIGFITAVFPSGLYALENAAYTLQEGKISNPLRSNAGYHIIKVNARRPARGEVEVAHILIRKTENDRAIAKSRIDSIYQMLKTGGDFDKMAQSLSEDAPTAQRNGYIGFISINRYERSFEEAAFNVKKDGEYSMPFESSVGWHIIKRISKKDIQPYSTEKSRLDNAIRKDGRFDQAKTAMLERIKRDAKFTEYPAVLNTFISTLADTFVTFKWKAPEVKSPELLFKMGKDFKVTLGDFTDYLGRAGATRVRQAKAGDVQKAAQALYQEFVNEQCMKYEETQLEAKYPDFKSLMREYEEGILLFEATKVLVWDKASEDSLGLAKFFETIKGKYRWEDRAVSSVYRISIENKDQVDAIRAYAQDHSADEVKAKFNTEEKILVNVESRSFEKGKSQELKSVEWKKGAMGPVDENARTKTIRFLKIEELLPPADKTLAEARGYIVADYQDTLERKWVDELKNTYKVKVNDKVLESLVKKK
jgi:peptidyl-prolyl cis-trans isomerase SurA